RAPMWPVPSSTTLAHVGPLARTTEDAALLFMTIAGYDARDPHAVAGPMPDLMEACKAGAKGMRIAYSRTFGYAKPDEDVLRVTARAVKHFLSRGCQVDHLEFVCEQDPVEMGSAEFSPAIGPRLRPIVEKQRDLLDPAVAEILDSALKLDLRKYYPMVFER